MAGIFGTRGTVFSDVSLIVEIITTILFTLGYLYQKRSGKHCALLVGAVMANTAFVIVYMVSRLVRLEIPSPSSAFATIYLAIAIVHGILSVVVFALAISQTVLGYRWRMRRDDLLLLGKRRGLHKKLGLSTLGLWYISFISGIVVYVILYIL